MDVRVPKKHIYYGVVKVKSKQKKNCVVNIVTGDVQSNKVITVMRGWNSFKGQNVLNHTYSGFHLHGFHLRIVFSYTFLLGFLYTLEILYRDHVYSWYVLVRVTSFLRCDLFSRVSSRKRGEWMSFRPLSLSFLVVTVPPSPFCFCEYSLFVFPSWNNSYPFLVFWLFLVVDF